MTETQSQSGTVSLILGIIGLFVFPIVLGALAIFFGTSGKSTAGTILGVIDVTVGVFMIVIYL